MKKTFLTLILVTFTLAFCRGQEDAEGSKDPAIFTRMPGFHIYRYDDIQFDRYEFPTGSETAQAVEGHYLYIIYWLNDNAQSPSPLQIARNYTNAVKKVGGQVIYEYIDGGTQNSVMKIKKTGLETWVHLAAQDNGTYSLKIIEKQAMTQDVLADAVSMAGSLRETGKVALYGIYFDTGLALLKPESKATLSEIAKLLQADANLKLYVVGHTDNTGSYEANIQLSSDRASAVVNALVKDYSVNPVRLKACGDGPTAPVASNDSPEGRALNRRVELVKQ